MVVAAGLSRAIWRTMIPKFYNTGLSFRASIASFRQTYGALSNVTALSDWRAINGLIKGEYASRNVDPAHRFPQNKMVETDLNRNYRYRVYGKVTYMNSETGETYDQMVSMYSNSWLSKNGWAVQFEKWKDKNEYNLDYDVDSIEMKVVEHNAGYSY